MRSSRPVLRCTLPAVLTAVGVGAIVFGAFRPVPASQRAERPVPLSAAPAPPGVISPRLQAIGRTARAQADAESPATVFPFATAPAGQGGALVVAHYFPPFPLSIGNAPAGADYYARQYLRSEGENGKFERQGGYLRDRPLPVTPGAAQANLALEVARAARIGIDAFGIDLLSIDKGRLWTTTTQLLDAVEATEPAFRVIPEPDMTALKEGKVDLRQLADVLSVFAAHPATYKLADGRMLVMPFRAESRDAAFWAALVKEMARRRTPVALAPVYLSTRAMRAAAPTSWAAGTWGDRDPEAGRRSAVQAASARAAGIGRWFTPVATQDYRPKSFSFWEARNTEAFRNQWQAALAAGGRMVHLVTWNDYSESSHLSPSAFTQFVFYDLAAYHIAWLKRGSPPAITHDALYYTHRPQVLDPDDSSIGAPMVRRGTSPLANDVELVAMLTQPGRIAITQGGRTVARDVGAGLQVLRMPAIPGRPRFTLSRGGRTVTMLESAWTIDPQPVRKDATYGGGSSTRKPVRTPGFEA